MNSASDLPPRTWHGWWLARPKWLRIAGWALLTLVLLNVALIVRIARRSLSKISGIPAAELSR